MSLANTEAAAALQSFQAPLRPRLLATGASDARWGRASPRSLQRDPDEVQLGDRRMAARTGAAITYF